MLRLAVGGVAVALSSTVSPLGRMLPASSDWLGRFRLSANAPNDYEIDREKQRRNTNAEDFTGIKGIHLQDQAITEKSMGAVVDRTREHLGSSDTMVIRARCRLIAAAVALAERRAVPPGVDSPEIYAVRAGGTFLPADQDWLVGTEQLRKGFKTHPDLDLRITGPLA
jgi:hypothetical protein